MHQRNEWFFAAGSLAEDGWQCVVGPQIDGWTHTGLRIGAVRSGGELELESGGLERVIVPLAGSFEVSVRQSDGAVSAYTLTGRASVFDGPSDVLYLGAGTAATITAAAGIGVGRVAVAEAPTAATAAQSRPTQYIARDDVPVELRGAGRSSRQVHNFGTPGTLDAAKLIVCEVITPAENWSSYPAHKHDEHASGAESQLEEIYYFETAVTKGADAPAGADPFGMFATYDSPAGAIDTNALVRTGDVALVPFGYHGPAAAAPGYDLYYLNVMAGPDDERVWNITDDPAHAWVRASWDDQQIDPRLPYGSQADSHARHERSHTAEGTQ